MKYFYSTCAYSDEELSFYSLNYSDYCYNAIHRALWPCFSGFFSYPPYTVIWKFQDDLFIENLFPFCNVKEYSSNHVFLFIFPLISFHSTTLCYWYWLNRGLHYGYMWSFPNIEVIFICSLHKWKMAQCISPVSITPPHPLIKRPFVFYNFSEKI